MLLGFVKQRMFLTVALCLVVSGSVTTMPFQSRPAMADAVAAAEGGASTSLSVLKDNYRRPAHAPHPKANPYTREKAELGRHLFFDPRLSRNGRVSCASCHNPSLNWSDGRARGVGVADVELQRRTPTVLNAAWLAALMWDGRAPTLEAQAVLPITAEHEMGLSTEEAVERIKEVAGYAPLFGVAFPGQEIGIESVVAALATYQRTLVSAESSFDRWIEGDEAAISEAAKRGFAVFNGAARCGTCHSSWRFTDDSFHDIGLASADIGRGAFAPPSVTIMQHAFKTPSLRDLRLSGPYMHDGSMATLDEVIDHYEDGGTRRPSLSPDMKPLTLSPQERQDLIAYLKTLQEPPLDEQAPLLP